MGGDDGEEGEEEEEGKVRLSSHVRERRVWKCGSGSEEWEEQLKDGMGTH